MKRYENDVERYLDEIRRLLPVSKEKKEFFLENFAEDIACHEDEVGGEMDYEGLVTYFGTPATIAKDYASAWADELTDTNAVTASRSTWKKIVFLLCAVLLLVLIICMIYGFLKTSFLYEDGYAMFLKIK